MMAVGVILWVFFLIWLVSALLPSKEMGRDAFGHCAYYSLLCLMLGIGIMIQYRIMADTGHAVLAITSDVIGVSLGAVRLWLIWRFRRHRHPSGGDDTAPELYHAH